MGDDIRRICKPMLKNLLDRLLHAVLGFMFGAILGAIGWWLYDAGMSARRHAPEIHIGIAQWIKYVGGGFALLGFLFKERTGSAVGRTATELYEQERDGEMPEVPRWLAVLLLLMVLAGVWYYVRQG